MRADSSCFACHRAWTAFYRQRWQLPRRILSSWQQAYARKVSAAKGYAEQCRTDSLFGHGAAVRACSLLPACNAVVTGAQAERDPDAEGLSHSVSICSLGIVPCIIAACRLRGPDGARVGPRGRSAAGVQQGSGFQDPLRGGR